MKLDFNIFLWLNVISGVINFYTRFRFYRLTYVGPSRRRWFSGLSVLLTVWTSSRNLPPVTLTYPSLTSGTRLPLPLTLGTYPDDSLSWVNTEGHWGPVLHSIYPHRRRTVRGGLRTEVLGLTYSEVLGVPVNSTVSLDKSLHRPCPKVGRDSGLPKHTLPDVTSYLSCG